MSTNLAIVNFKFLPLKAPDQGAGPEVPALDTYPCSDEKPHAPVPE